MTEWQDIATAPKDGTEFIGWSEFSLTAAIYAWKDAGYKSGGIGWVAMHDGRMVIEYQDDFGTEYRGGEFLTHWMSLPEPPMSETYLQRKRAAALSRLAESNAELF